MKTCNQVIYPIFGKCQLVGVNVFVLSQISKNCCFDMKKNEN